MKPTLNMDRIAAALRGERRGRVHAGGGPFGVMEIAAELASRLRIPEKGGRPTDPMWTERRQVPMRPETLRQLEELAARQHVHPMQLAALFIEMGAREAMARASANPRLPAVTG